MSGPSNETEAEKLQRRQVEALERIACALEMLTNPIYSRDGDFYVLTREMD